MESKKKKLKTKKQRGITLIALVVTIVVLLILASVSITVVFGDNGILELAKEAGEKTNNAEDNDLRQMTIAKATMNFDNTEYTDKNEEKITIPAGLAVSLVDGENVIDNGLVAIDKVGNEWVWIKVPDWAWTKFNEGTPPNGETDYEKIERILQLYTASYKGENSGKPLNWKDEYYDGCALNAEQYINDYHAMLTSIYVNGGFWIGRYEAGIEGTTGDLTEEALSLGRTSNTKITNSSPRAICQKDAVPYNWLDCNEAQYLASKMNVTADKHSSLPFGIQWDLACIAFDNDESSGLGGNDLLADGRKWGNYNDTSLDITSIYAKKYETSTEKWSMMNEKKKTINKNNNVLLSTGASDITKKMNIYDFAGNLSEWTLAHNERNENGVKYPCTFRSGSFNDVGQWSPPDFNGAYQVGVRI